MRIRQISVTKLFGIFDHTIPMNHDDRITIIHGPNGFGKTALLSMVNSIFNTQYGLQYGLLSRTPFKEFILDFDNGKSLQVTKEESRKGAGNKQGESDTNLVFSYSGEDEYRPRPTERKEIEYYIRRFIPE